ncbi:MAG TPA: outer membrane beta-barrel protein [Lacunisphaera sp.]
MKKFVSLALIATSLAVSAQALILAGSAGYLVDSEEEYLTARIGHEFKATSSLSHQGEIEFAYTGSKESGVKANIYPITANYRLVNTVSEKVSYHFGAGAGLAISEVSGYGISDSGSSFTAQGFAGLDYRLSPNVTAQLGAKYIWIDNVKLFGTSIEVGDDIALSAGISIRF